jgi:hypothetical protein
MRAISSLFARVPRHTPKEIRGAALSPLARRAKLQEPANSPRVEGEVPVETLTATFVRDAMMFMRRAEIASPSTADALQVIRLGEQLDVCVAHLQRGSKLESSVRHVATQLAPAVQRAMAATDCDSAELKTSQLRDLRDSLISLAAGPECVGHISRLLSKAELAESLRESIDVGDGVTSVVLRAPPAGGVLDLRSLRAASGELKIELRCDENWEAFEVWAPAHAKVFARPRAPAPEDVVARKATVVFFDESGARVSAPRPIPGLIRHSNPLRSMQVDVNGRAKFPLKSGTTRLVNRRIVCRHLAVQWLRDRMDFRKAKERGEAQRFPYGDYMSQVRVADHVSLQTEAEYQALVEAGAQALIPTRDLGNQLALGFAQMASKGETQRLFLLELPTHVVDCELLVRDGRYVVNVYDPASGAKHDPMEVDDPVQLGGFALEHWIPASRMGKYYQPGPRMCAVYRYTAEPGPAEGARVVDLQHVPDAMKATPEFLYWALREGLADEVEQSLRRALQQRHLLAMVNGVPGVRHALTRGHVAALEAWMRAVLDAPEHALPYPEKIALLSQFAVEQSAFDYGHAKVTALFARLVANAPNLLPDDKQALLLAREPLPPAGRPTLHRIAEAATFVHADPELPGRQHEAIYEYLREVAASTNVSLQCKQRIFAASHGSPARTAAQVAMAHDNPGASAAMVRATHDTAPSDQVAALLRALDV